MKPRKAQALGPLLVLVSALAIGPPASAETTQCTAITSLPYVIAGSGVYCLTGDLATSMASGNAITINANAVTLDLNGHKLGGAGAGLATLAVGVWAQDRQNIVVKNGTIRGFAYAVKLLDSSGSSFANSLANTVEDVTADSNRVVGIRVDGRGCRVRHNHIVSTGGTTAYTDSAGAAIEVSGTGNVIRDNEIADVVGTGIGDGVGIMAFSSYHTVIESNRIASAETTGIFAEGLNVLVSDNRLTNMPTGIYFSAGSGKYRNNLTSGVPTLIAGAGTATDAGGNN